MATFCGIIHRVPEPVGEPHGIGFHGIPVLVPVPAVVGMGPVLDVENGVTEAGLAVRRVRWLRLSHAVEQKKMRQV